MNTSLNFTTLEKTYSCGAYVKRSVQLARGEGAKVWDTEGRVYVDCVSGQGASNLGHAHPALLEAMQRQMSEIMVCPELFQNPTRGRYQEMLCEATGMSRVFLCTSGAEAVEAALKFARLSTGRTGVISTMRAYHGRTMGALSTTWEPKLRAPFEPLLPDIQYVPFNDINSMKEAIDDTIAAVIIEPIQGYGGVRPASVEYLQAVQELCREHGALFMMDEIQTGFGRAGSLFAFQDMGLEPDILCLAKSIGGGIPMGAVMLHERMGEMPAASHGSTFGGHPMGCAAGIAMLEVLQNSDLIERSKRLGEQVMQHLHQSLPKNVVRDVRGKGFMIGIELYTDVAPVLQKLQDRGVLAMPAGPQVIRLLPPLVITDDELWQVVDIIKGVLNELD